MATSNNGRPETQEEQDTRIKNRAFLIQAGIVVTLFLGFCLVYAVWGVDPRPVIKEHKAQTSNQARALPVPLTVRVSLARCVESKNWGSEYSRRTGFAPSNKFTDPDPSLLDAMAESFLTECVESFVLDGGTVSEMQSRAQMLQAHLSEEFQGGELALALQNGG